MPAQFFDAIDGPAVGIDTTLRMPVRMDPGGQGGMGPKPTGCWIAHRTAWAAVQLLPGDAFLILEDDAVFAADWRARVEQALRDVPADWDVLFVGSCCAGGRSQRRVQGQVYEVRWPQCLHAYVVRRKALGMMIATTDGARATTPIDISLIDHTWPHLRVYTILPRVVEQRDTVIPP